MNARARARITKDTVLDCGHVPTPQPEGGGGTGYGYDRRTGKVSCYACCALNERARMLKTGRATLYLSRRADGRYEVTDWPGHLRFLVAHSRVGRHNIASKRYDVWFSLEGRTWHGVTYGDNTQICHCRRMAKGT